MINERKIIGVIGGHDCSPETYVDAEVIGRVIAEKNITLICGGLTGVMEAACKGAFKAGGDTIGILPGDSIYDANPYVTIPIATGMGIGRNIIIVRSAQALIAVGGRYGTLSEIAYALQLNKPVFSLNSWEEIEGVTSVENPANAVDQALRAISDELLDTEDETDE